MPGRPDGTMVLVKVGACFLAVGIICLLITEFGLGGVHHHGPSGNAAWMFFMTALFCLPMGCMTFGLGGAKWLRNRRLARQG